MQFGRSLCGQNNWIYFIKEFCNQFIFNEPQQIGVFTTSGFLLFWGIVYVIVISFVAMFKKEEPDINTQLEEHALLGLWDYKSLFYFEENLEHFIP
jgi:Acetyl-coenzyme A transporter 1